MTTCVIYLRISREKNNGEKELSIDSQLNQCKKKAKALGANVLRVFTDRDKSGRNDRRRGFQDALVFCDCHQVDFFITWSTSRFARNMLEAKQNKLRLNKAGTHIHYVTTTIADSDAGYLQETIHELFDDYQSRLISQDTRRSMSQNARDGYFNGGRAPFGYKPAPHPLNHRRRTLVINQGEADIVKRIFNMRISGTGAKLIADALNDESITMRDKPWSKKRITAILRNTKMIGQTIFGKLDVNRVMQPVEKWIITNSHEPIIDTNTWENVQAIMDGGVTKQANGSPLSTWLFTGILRCGECGDTMKIMSGKGRSRRYYYYNCKNHIEGTGCRKNTIRADEFDAWMLTELCKIIFSPANLKKTADTLNTKAQEWVKHKKTAQSELLREQATLQQRNNRLYELLEDPAGPLSIAELSPRLKSNTARLHEIKKELDIIERRPLPGYKKIKPAELSEYMTSNLIEACEPSKKRGFINMIISDLKFKNRKLQVEYRPEALMDPALLRFPAGVKWLPDGKLLGTISIDIEMPESIRLNAA